MKVTIKDIARECGLSTAAVSMALSDRPNRISQNTRDLVRMTAERLHYQPNQAAVSLITRRSKRVGIVINDLTNPHISSLFMAINSVIQKRGYHLLCHVLIDCSENATEGIQRILSSDVDGIIWGKPIKESEREKLQVSMGSIDIPVIAMDESGFPCPGADIVFDYEKAGYLATQHLLEMGHRRIGCVAGTADFKVTIDRLCGYRRALDEAGVPFDQRLVYDGNYTLASGRDSLSYLLGQKVTAIFAMNDEMAFGLYQSARQYGIRIPTDLSVIGCDNVPFGDTLEIPLSTLNVPTEEMGRVIGMKMIEAIEGEMDFLPGGKRIRISYEPALLLKGSTARIQNDVQM